MRHFPTTLRDGLPPSVKRYIKTVSERPAGSACSWVRKHRAPKDALRQCVRGECQCDQHPVRKHRAPKGALRLEVGGGEVGGLAESESTERQKVH